MYFYYPWRRQEFLRHYHQRGNAESTFAMVKAKFRDRVRSKTDVAMTNEVLCKFRCHNLCAVHQSHLELGIVPALWGERPARPAAGTPAVLPSVPPGEGGRSIPEGERANGLP